MSQQNYSKESEQVLEFCTEQEICIINIRKSIDFYNSERKFEKLTEKYLVQNDNPQIKNTSESVQRSLKFW